MASLGATDQIAAGEQARKAGRAWLWTAAFALFVAVVAIVSVMKAARRPFWYDEICTVIVVQQKGLTAQWKALSDGIDMNPPGFHLIETPFARAISKKEIGYRIAPLLGCLLMQICLFVFARRSGGYTGAFAAAIVPSLTTALLYFTEARPYGLVLGFASLALVCWQRADRAAHAAGMAGALAAALCCHYYAIFVIASLAFTEALASAFTRRFRPSVWVGFLISATPLLAFWPLMRRIKGIYGAHFWAKPVKNLVVTAYGPLLGIGKGLALTLIVLLAAGLIAILLKHARRPDRTAVLQDACAALGFLCLPAFAVAVAAAAHGGLTERYMLPAILGVAIGAGMLLGRTHPRVATVVIAAFAIFAIARHIGGPKPAFDMNAADESVVTGFLQQHPDAQVVISDGLTFLPMAYYAPRSVSARICALIDANAAIRYIGTDSIEVALVLVQKYLPLRLIQTEDLAHSASPMYVYSDRRTVFDWPPRYLVHEGYGLRAVRFAEKSTLYRVVLPANTPAAASVASHAK